LIRNAVTVPTLVIGNKAYSSWSMRPWLLMRQTDIAFSEIRLPMKSDEWRHRIAHYSPSGRVPVLIDGDITVWDSLAIAEYLAEKHPEQPLWPRDPAARAVARSVSAEMHSGFQALRTQMPMNVRRQRPGQGHTPQALADVARITALWHDCRRRFAGAGLFLFGAFSIADAMYAPVVSRLLTYAVEVDAGAAQYVRAVSSLPAFRAWIAEAQAETDFIADYEQ
jgi:glutathione S-transferase